MKFNFILTLFFLFTCTCQLHAQLENVIVETYYISDSKDATDTTGGILTAGTTTYRIYIDMVKGSKLLKIYGNKDHELKIASDSVFFNHATDGQTFAENFDILRFKEGTIALDTWLAMGQTTMRTKSGKTNFGTPKPLDRNGSFIGGANNDGGSSSIASGLLSNNDPGAGIPLTTSDGMDTMNISKMTFVDNGILKNDSDLTIFGSIKKEKKFVSKNVFFSTAAGITGVNRDSNQVLIAQLTTRGKISFSLNIDMEVYVNKSTLTYHYVAKNGNDSIEKDVFQSPLLNYPQQCGCIDPNFLEFKTTYGCSDSTACKTPVVLGCNDPAACNYDARVNLNLSVLCCYPGLCNNRDISLVCPALAVKELILPDNFELFPNPSENQLTLKNLTSTSKNVRCSIYDGYGALVIEKNLGIIATNAIQMLDVSILPSGFYMFKLLVDNFTIYKKFVKN